MMSPHSWPLVGAETMRALDRHTIEHLGVPADLLMESAGRAAAETVLEVLPEGGEVVLVCGTGNNGGDGFVVARHLHLLGVPVRLALLGEMTALKNEAAANARRARSAGVEIGGPSWRGPRRGVIVDAILGTGLSRPIEKAVATSIRKMEKARGPNVRVVSLDIPSGICADTGQPLGGAVRADATVTFGLPKLGLTLEPGRSHAGRIVVARIGIADAAPGLAVNASVWTRAAAGARMPARPPEGHKGRFGHVLLAAGSEGKTGAAALAAEAATRVGAGLVTLACPAGVNDILEVKCTEAMTAPLPDTAGRTLAAGGEEALVALAAERDVLGLGPGLGRSEDTAKLVRAVTQRVDCPVVLDADGLHAFAATPELLRSRASGTVLTPHPGEAAALLGSSSRAVNADRPGAARALAERTGAVALLKGAGTVTASPGGELVVNPTGGPALGSGGTGDVLLGMVVGLLGQGLDPFEAAALAAFWHGFAADRIAARSGPAGLIASDLARELPETGRVLRAAAASPRPEGHLALAFPEP